MTGFMEMLDTRIIPIVRGLDSQRAPDLAEALAAGGVTTIEVTIESPGSLDAIATLAGGHLVVGAGTVLSPEMARAAVDVGAQYLVSPNANEELMRWAADRSVPYLPGVFTPTEAALALSAGLRHVKLFPATVGGPGLVRALLGPYPELQIVVTGGIDGDNAVDFIDAGAVAVGVGSWLVGHDKLSVVTERALSLREALTPSDVY